MALPWTHWIGLEALLQEATPFACGDPRHAGRIEALRAFAVLRQVHRRPAHLRLLRCQTELRDRAIHLARSANQFPDWGQLSSAPGAPKCDPLSPEESYIPAH